MPPRALVKGRYPHSSHPRIGYRKASRRRDCESRDDPLQNTPGSRNQQRANLGTRVLDPRRGDIADPVGHPVVMMAEDDRDDLDDRRFATNRAHEASHRGRGEGWQHQDDLRLLRNR